LKWDINPFYKLRKTGIIGEREREEGQYALKNMESGEQEMLGVEEAVEMLLN